MIPYLQRIKVVPSLDMRTVVVVALVLVSASMSAAAQEITVTTFAATAILTNVTRPPLLKGFVSAK
jgi:hypothetical protein